MNRLRSTLTAAALATFIAVPVAALASDCSVTSVGFTPLNDLGTGLYRGVPGGLYGNGSNVRPAAHDSSGIAIANALVPLDTLGHLDPNGRIVMVSIGMSNCTFEYSTFIPIANADPHKNPRVLLIDCAEGGQSADLIRNPASAYWDTVRTRLRAQHSSPAQVQVVWSKEANKAPTGSFPASADSLTWNMGSVVRNVKAFLPNVKLAYLTSRIYAGYATTNLNPEPYAYESGFAFKWLIDAQIAGVDSLNYDPARGLVVAPWLSWGPYLWADGLTPRSDGLTWACSEFNSDGTHPSTSGRTKVADSLLVFLKRDATTRPWFVVTATAAVPELGGSGVALAVRPNPARGEVSIAFTPPVGVSWRLELLDAAGRRVVQLGRGIGSGAPEAIRWDFRRAPDAPRAGVYWLRAIGEGRMLARRRLVIAP